MQMRPIDGNSATQGLFRFKCCNGQRISVADIFTRPVSRIRYGGTRHPRIAADRVVRHQWKIIYNGSSVCMAVDSTMPRKLKTVVLQRSVLGPLLLTLYTVDNSKVIRPHGLLHHSYATLIKYMHHVCLLTAIILNRKSSLSSDISQS